MVVSPIWIGVWTHSDLRYRQGENARDERCEEDGEVHVVDLCVRKECMRVSERNDSKVWKRKTDGLMMMMRNQQQRAISTTLYSCICKRACPTSSTRSLRVDLEASGNVHLCYPCCLANTQSQTMLSSQRRTRIHYTCEAEILRCPNWVSESQLIVESEKSSNVIGGEGLRTFAIQLGAYHP
jgi:hypothetical protein